MSREEVFEDIYKDMKSATDRGQNIGEALFDAEQAVIFRHNHAAKDFRKFVQDKEKSDQREQEMWKWLNEQSEKQKRDIKEMRRVQDMRNREKGKDYAMSIACRSRGIER